MYTVNYDIILRINYNIQLTTKQYTEITTLWNKLQYN